MEKAPLEQIYNELFEAGLSNKEINEYIGNTLYFRYLDTVSPSEAILRYSMDAHDRDMMEDIEMNMEYIEYGNAGDDLAGNGVKDSSYSHSKEMRKLQQEVAEMRDRMNDILIEKHTQPIEIEEKEEKLKDKKSNTKKNISKSRKEDE